MSDAVIAATVSSLATLGISWGSVLLAHRLQLKRDIRLRQWDERNRIYATLLGQKLVLAQLYVSRFEAYIVSDYHEHRWRLSGHPENSHDFKEANRWMHKSEELALEIPKENRELMKAVAGVRLVFSERRVIALQRNRQANTQILMTMARHLPHIAEREEASPHIKGTHQKERRKSMATKFGGVPVRGEDGSMKSGSVFELSNAPSSDNSLTDLADWTVEVRKGLTYAIAHSPVVMPRTQALDEAVDAVQQALDVLCVAEHQRLRVHNFEREHMVWYEEDGRSILRTTTVSGLGISTGMSVKITHADGSTDEPDLNPMPPWHECFRYYRLAQVSDDPFDAYRNLWLSLELAFSLKSSKKPGEREVNWLKSVGGSLESTLPGAAWPSSAADPVEYLVQDHYVDTRCRLFHAKGGKPRLSPHVAADRRMVIDRFATLQPFVREVLAEVAGAPRGGGVVTNQGFQRLMEAAHGDGLILLSDSQDEVDQSETLTSDCWLGAIIVPGPRMADESRPGLELRGCRVEANKLAATNVCRIGLASKGKDEVPDVLHTSSLRHAVLELDDDFNLFEPVCGVELVNQSSPRVRFKL